MLVIIVIVTIILAIRLNDVQNQLCSLKKENEKLHENIYRMATLLNEQNRKVVKKQEEIENIKQEEIENKKIEETSIQIKKEKAQKKEFNRNNLILIAGSIFIVLAALLFLTSTWNIIPNVMKSLILLLLVFIFLGTSYYAEQKLKIEKTAKAFFYIAMIYIPIMLYSIAYLGLLGSYFMINSSGFPLYVAFTSIITSIIYILYSKKEEKLHYGSCLIQLIAIISFGIYLQQGYEMIYLLLTFYNMAIIIKNIYCKKTKITNQIEKLLTITIAILVSLFLITNILLANIKVELLLAGIISLGITLYRSKEYKQYQLFSNLLIVINIAALTVLFNLPIVMKEFIILLTLLGIYIWYEHHDSSISFPILVVTFPILWLTSILHTKWMPSLIILIAILINMYRHIKTKNTTYIAITIWLLMILYILLASIFNIGYTGFIYLLAVSEIIKTLVLRQINKETTLYSVIECNSNVIVLPNLLIFSIIEVIFQSNIMFLIPLIIALTNYFNYVKTKKNYYLLITYISSAVLLETINNLFSCILPKCLSFPVVAIILILIKFYQKEKLKEESIFITFYILSLIISFITELNVGFLVIMSFITITLLFNYKYQKNKTIEILSYIALTYLIYSKRIILYNITLNPIVSLIVIIIWMARGYLAEERTVTDWISCGYIILDYLIYPISKYYTICLLILWSLVNLEQKKQHHHLVKLILYISFLCLYNAIVKDIGIRLTILNLLGYFTTLYMISRTIVKEKNEQQSLQLEWIATVILCLIAITMYYSQLDGILFVSFLMIMMIISYIKKLEPTFYISLMFILINVFLLTKEFWFSLPWWLYLLVIGVILILFATNNELQVSVKEQKILKICKNHFKNKIKYNGKRAKGIKD